MPIHDDHASADARLRSRYEPVDFDPFASLPRTPVDVDPFAPPPSHTGPIRGNVFVRPYTEPRTPVEWKDVEDWFRRTGRTTGRAVGLLTGHIPDPRTGQPYRRSIPELLFRTLPEAARRVATLPRRVWTGEVQSGSQEELEGALDLASIITFGPLPVTLARGAAARSTTRVGGGRLPEDLPLDYPSRMRRAQERGFVQRVYHGTWQPGFREFRETPGEWMIDRILGTHVAPDPTIANTFTVRGSGQQGGVYPLLMPDDSRFWTLPQKPIPSLGWPHKRNAVTTDQYAIEQEVMKVAYRLDPALFERHLRDRWSLDVGQAKEAAHAILSNRPYQAPFFGYPGAAPVRGLADYVERSGSVRPFNKDDTIQAVELFKDHLQRRGFIGVKYVNTSPVETAGAHDFTSYVVFDPKKHLRSQFARFDPRSRHSGDLLASGTGRGLDKELSTLEAATTAREQLARDLNQLRAAARTDPALRPAVRQRVTELRELEKQIEDMRRYTEVSVSAPQDQLGFVHKSHVTVLNTDRAAGTVDNWVVEFKKAGVKNEELEWLGLADRNVLSSHGIIDRQGMVSRKALLEHIEDKRVRIEEVVSRPAAGAVALGRYTLKPHRNYRELRFLFPSNMVSAQTTIGARETGSFRTPHWPQSNVFAHVRLTDRIDDRNRKILFVEEMQSDWHQHGAAIGYYRPSPQSAEADALRGQQHRVADAPFKTSWHKLVMKRLLRMAADEGYDAVALAPSLVQRSRWGEEHRRFYEELYDKKLANTMKRLANRYGGRVGTTELVEGNNPLSAFISRHGDYEHVIVDFMPRGTHAAADPRRKVLHSPIIYITPELKQRVQAGQELFVNGIPAAPVEHDPFDPLPPDRT